MHLECLICDKAIEKGEKPEEIQERVEQFNQDLSEEEPKIDEVAESAHKINAAAAEEIKRKMGRQILKS